MKDTLKTMFTLSELNTLFGFLYLAENAEESGVKGSAWELLWDEYQKDNTLWAYVQNELSKAGIVVKSDDVFQALKEKA